MDNDRLLQEPLLSKKNEDSNYKTEIVGYENREDDYTSVNNASAYNMPPNNLFAPEDNFYIDSVERYNVKYKPPAP